MEKYSFFNSINHDRTYNADDLTDYFKEFFSNGIFAINSGNLKVYAHNNNQLRVAVGSAFINGKRYYNTSDLILNVDTPSLSLDRIDRVVLELDNIQRLMKIKILKGDNSSNPQPKQPTKTTDIFQLVLADVRIVKGSRLNIRDLNITDQRLNTQLCGAVINPLNTVDFSEYNKQLRSAISTIQPLLDSALNGTVAEQLKNEIIRNVRENLAQQLVNLVDVKLNGRVMNVNRRITINNTNLRQHTINSDNYYIYDLIVNTLTPNDKIDISVSSNNKLSDISKLIMVESLDNKARLYFSENIESSFIIDGYIIIKGADR